jgi:hypothetical protein
MKYTLEVDIELPRERVVELFDNPENLRHWQTGFLSYEPGEGTPGQVGSTTKLKYVAGKREIELVETITIRNLPDEFAGTYEMPGIWNIVHNRFIESGPEQTRWVSDVEFRAEKFSMKLMMWLMPGAFRKQSRAMMYHFKQWAESTSG